MKRLNAKNGDKNKMAEMSALNKLKQEEREIRRNLIIDAAQKIFANKTFDRASMREIARQANMAPSSIYTYFENQETLFVAAILRETNELLKEMESMVSQETKIDIEHLMNHYLDFCIDHETHWRMLTHFFLYGNISSESSIRLNHAARRMLDIFDSIFKKMNYKGDVRLLSHTFFSSLSGILISFRKYPGRSDDEIRIHMKRIAKVIIEMLLPYIEADQIQS